jgi:hypothetical protein
MARAPRQIIERAAREDAAAGDLPNAPTSVSTPADSPWTPEPVRSSPMGQEGSAPHPAMSRARGPRLALVPNNASDAPSPRAQKKATWPFTPNERTDSEPPTESVEKQISGDGKPKSERARVRVLSGRPPTSAGIMIPGIGLPPATDSESQQIRLKRSESVIAEAAKARKGLWRVGAIAKRATTDVASAVSNMGYAAVSMIGERSVNAVRHFEALPRNKQIAWVAAPYAVVLVLVVILVELKEPANAAATVIAPSNATSLERAAVVPATIAQPTPATAQHAPFAVAPIAIAPPPALAQKADASTDLPLTSPNDRGPRASHGVWKTVPIPSSLRVKPDPNALKAGRLKVGSRVIVYPDFPTREGWVLTQRPGGEIGFLIASHLDGKKDPRFDKISEARKAKRSKKQKIDPFTEVRRPRSQRGPRS